MKVYKILFILAIVMGCAKQPAGPHFVGNTSAVLAKDGQSVLITWKEAGLRNTVSIDYEASAAATATYVCVNNSGRCPNAENKQTVSGPVTATVVLSSDQNGQISGTMVLLAPGAGDFACPGGQLMMLSEVHYSDIAIADLTNGITENTEPDALSAVPFTCP